MTPMIVEFKMLSLMFTQRLPSGSLCSKRVTLEFQATLTEACLSWNFGDLTDRDCHKNFVAFWKKPSSPWDESLMTIP